MRHRSSFALDDSVGRGCDFLCRSRIREPCMVANLCWKCLISAGTQAAQSLSRRIPQLLKVASGLIHGATVIGVAIAIITFVIELEDRQNERYFRGWQVVRAGTAGFSQREAIEYLNREFDGFGCVGLVNWLSNWLTGNSQRSCLIPQKERDPLIGADLMSADLTDVDLTEADLTDVDLREANLTGADLRKANLTDANLTATDLKDAKNLTQEQLDAACGFSPPKNIPQGLNWKHKSCSS